MEPSELTAAPSPASARLGRFEVPLSALAAAAFFCALFVVPLLGALGVPLASVPLVRLAHRQGLVTGMLACAVAVAIVFGLGWATGGLSGGLVLAFLGAGVMAVPAASVGFLRAGVEPSRCYLGLCVAGCAFLAATYAAVVGGPGPSPAAEVAATFDRLIPAAVDSYTRSGADTEALARMRRTLEAGREFSRHYLWGILGGLWVFGGALAFYGGARAARPVPTAEAARFELLRVPAAAAGLFVATGAAFGLLAGEGRRMAGNLLLPLSALFFVAGLSIICHFFRRWFRVRILRVGLYALAAYFPINVGVALLGLFDWYVDFRRRGEGVGEKS
jgi:hypothetical protein